MLLFRVEISRVLYIYTWTAKQAGPKVYVTIHIVYGSYRDSHYIDVTDTLLKPEVPFSVAIYSVSPFSIRSLDVSEAYFSSQTNRKQNTQAVCSVSYEKH